MKNFALIGAAGYIAPRHLKAIKDTGNKLLAALDPFDSVGVIDSYFPEAAFFVEFERFDRHIDKMKRQGTRVDYLSVCSPNYLHDSHIRFALRNGADVICEKPLVLRPTNAAALQQLEKEMGRKIYTVLQLRHHPNLIKLKDKIKAGDKSKVYDIDLTYITSRGSWYYTSWKGDVQKSGGIATNIGIHFFDMLLWLFGEVKSNIVHLHTHDRASGLLELANARVRWFLSINADTLPEAAKKNNLRTYRSMTLEGTEIEFNDGFADLHTRGYEEILKGNGFGVADALPGIALAYDIRSAQPVGLKGDFHPFSKFAQSDHPFTKA